MRPPTAHLLVLPFLMTLSLLPRPARAQDAVKIDLVRKGQENQSFPRLILTPQVDASVLSVRISCGGVQASRAGPAPAGTPITLELKVRSGNTSCTGSLHGEFSDGSEGDMPLNFQVTMHPPLQVKVPKESLDLSQNMLSVVLDRPASLIELQVFGDAGRELGAGTAPAHGSMANSPIPVQWQARPGEVFRVHVKAIDADGFWGALDLFPWSYNIPHEDVVFESGKWEIQPTQEQKLTSALSEAEKVLGKYTLTEIPMRLYIGGYTDTVGESSRNQNLSRERAAAIARWFRAHGWSKPIYYQGFGEDALAVPTPDETDEVRNRRSTYVISADNPGNTGDFPRSDWKILQ